MDAISSEIFVRPRLVPPYASDVITQKQLYSLLSDLVELHTKYMWSGDIRAYKETKKPTNW